jgi:hypothetical protein
LGGQSSAGQLSRLEVAGLLKGLSPEAVNLALAKYCGDLGAERALIAQVRTWAAGVAVKEQWPVVRGRPTVVNMCALAVMEVVRPNRCATCKGTGYKGVRLCQSCNGVGVKGLAGVVVAEACGLDGSNYLKTWRRRYEVVLQRVSDYESDVVVLVNKNNKYAEA